jgi:hypothetical protein
VRDLDGLDDGRHCFPVELLRFLDHRTASATHNPPERATEIADDATIVPQRAGRGPQSATSSSRTRFTTHNSKGADHDK